MKNKYAKNFVIGALLLWGVAYSTSSANYPKIYSPYSLVVIMPELALHEFFRNGNRLIIYLMSALVIPLFFLFWSFHLLRGQVQIPKRSKIATILLGLLSLLWLIVSLPYGIQYQGIVHTIAIDIFNMVCWSVLIFLYRSNKTHASYTSNYLFHWVLFAWLGWVAFPWLGELL